MNLLISPLRISLGKKNLNRMMWVCLDGPKKLLVAAIEKLINTFIAAGCHIDLQFIYFLVYASVVMVILLCSFIVKRISYFVFFILTLFTSFGLFIFTCLVILIA